MKIRPIRLRRDRIYKYTILNLLIILSFSACSTPETNIRTDVEIPVGVEEINLKSIEEIVIATGTVNATVDAIIKSEITGTYQLVINPSTSRSFAIGDRVKKDQIIITLENPEQENRIRIESQAFSLQTAKDDFENQKTLYDKGGISLSELKRAEKTLLDAQYNYDSAVMELAAFKIKSPFDGILVDINYYTPGVEIPANSEVFHIMDFAVLNMDINLPGKLIGNIKENQGVRVVSYMNPDVKIDAVITQVSPTLEPNTRTFKAIIQINNRDLALRPGMFVKAEIITASRENTIVIPKNIILVRRTNKTVFVIEDGVARQRTIKTGLENPDEVEVIDGLYESDYLVVEGFETLRNGSRVTISNR